MPPGADVDLTTDAGRTALHYTASKGRRTIAETLIARRANVNKKDKVCKTSNDVDGIPWESSQACLYNL